MGILYILEKLSCLGLLLTSCGVDNEQFTFSVIYFQEITA